MRLATADQNKITVEKDGATFYGRVVPKAEINAIRDSLKEPPKKDGDPPHINEEEFMLAMFDAAVTGWSGLTNFEEVEIPHAPGVVRSIEEFNQGFANSILMEIHAKATKIRKREDAVKESERKNS